MPQSFVLSFKENIILEEQSQEQLFLQTPSFSFTLKDLSPGLRTALKTLASGGTTEENLSDLVLANDDTLALSRFYYYMKKFADLCLICHTVLADRTPLAAIVPVSQYYRFNSRNVTAETKYVLSRFAYCRKHGNQLLLESPLSYAQIILFGWQASALLNELAHPCNCRALSSKIPGISADAVKMFLDLLLNARAVSEIKEDGKIEEDLNTTLLQWDFHDLLFHSRTRMGRHANPYGGTFRFWKKIDPPPVTKPNMSNEAIDLYKPDIEKLKEEDYPLTLALEERQSIRKYADKPITDRQLGEFLYRSARIRKAAKSEMMEISSRPYPGGGAIYELELYLAVNTCENIPSGLYHYNPLEHKLYKISDRNSYVEALLKDAWRVADQESIPEILIIITARFQRISWKYESLAYSLILKDVGVLYQTMYLVATAMDLSPCALGAGNSDLFALGTGIDYYSESSVGEFMLGRKRI